MQIINTSLPVPTDTLSQLALYSAMDVLSLFEIFDGISALMDEPRWATYKFEMQLMAPLLSMSLVGIPVDITARQKMIQQFTLEQDKLTALINRLLESMGYFEYYRNMAALEFSSQVDYSPLPLTWEEWLSLPIATRRAIKKAAPAALVKYQKALKEFSLPFNPISPAQKLQLFYHFLGSPSNLTAKEYFLPPPWLKTHGISEYKTRNTKNEYVPAADREALEKMLKDTRQAAQVAAPLIHICLAVSDLSKSLGFLNCKLEHGLFKSSFGVVTETGRLASRQNAQGYGSNAQNVSPKLRHIFIAPSGEKFVVCDYAQIESRIVAAICYRLFGATNYLAMTECLTKEHEVLTPSGWVSISEKPSVLACWNIEDQCITFDSPIKWVEYEAEETMTIKTKCFSLTATPNHIMPYQTRSDSHRLDRQPMYRAYKKTQFHVKLSGNYSGPIQVNSVHAQLLAAYQADGYLTNNCVVEFSFSRKRKIKRMHSLLQKAGIAYSINDFPSYSPGRKPSTRFYIKSKDWPTTLHKHAGSYLLDWTYSALKAYTLEHEYWDGNRERSLSFRVTNKSKTHLEWIGTIAHLVNMSATAPIPDHDSWRISIRNSTITDIGTSSGMRYTSNKPDTVYCPTVNTGFFVVRKDGFISITGNCGDAHSLCASMVWDDLPWPADFTLDWTIKHGPFPKDILKAAKKIASEPFYRGKSRRDVSKTLGHGCLTADHEVLTPEGWVPISKKPPIIMQWPGKFVTVSNWTDKPYTGLMIEWEGQSISLNMTADHRVYYSTPSNASIIVKPAALVPRASKIMLGNSYIGGSIQEPLARLLAAYHCDGTWEGYHRVRFNLNKTHKINRLKELAGVAGMALSEYENPNLFSLDWIPTIHEPSWDMLQWNKASLFAYMDELNHWDEHIENTSLHSKHRHWLERWQTFNRILGKGGNIQNPKIMTTMFSLEQNNKVLANRVSFTKDCVYEVNNLQVFCPTVPSQAFYVRRKGKISVTGNSNYLGKPKHMAKQSHIDIKLTEHYQAVYFNTCPELPKWHRWVAEQVQTKGEIVTMLGRPRRFFNRPNDDATIREAVAYEPQSVAADYCNRALLRLFNLYLAGKFPATIRLSKHDELVVSCAEALEEQVLAIMQEQMEEHITITSPNGITRDWYIPAEAESGWNLGRKSATNPDGLSHPLDGRTRQFKQTWAKWKV